MVFKDFTSVLTMQKDARGEIMGQLREIYDGSMTKRYGNGVIETWEGKLGFIAGVTSAIYTNKRSYAAMGERFIIYNFLQPDPVLATERGMDNVADVDMRKRRAEIQKAAKEFLDETITIPEEVPKIHKSLRRELIELANMATQARSAVERDWGSARKEMEFIHAREMPIRFATQLSMLGSAMMVMNQGSLEDADKNILYKIALDSIDQNRRLVLQTLAGYSTTVTSGMAKKINYPTDTTRRWLEDCAALGLVQRLPALKGEGNADRWKLKPEYAALFEKFEGVKMLDAELIETNAEAVEMSQQDQDKAVETALEVFGGEVVEEQSQPPLPTEPPPAIDEKVEGVDF
jgi:hypothetical protein